MATIEGMTRMRTEYRDERDYGLGVATYGQAAIALALGWLILAWPWLSGRFTIPWDAKAHFQPQIQFLADSLARGDSPFWNPYVFSGHPQVADPQSMIFSIPFLALAAVTGTPSLWAVDTTVFVVILVSALFLMAWMRDQGWHPAGALVASLAYGFGAAMAWRVQHTGQVMSLAHLPVVLFFLDRAFRTGGIGYGMVAGIVGGLMVIGRDQVALLSVYLLIGFALWRLWFDGDPAASLRRTGISLVSGGLAGLLVIAVPVALSIALASQSNRPAIDFIGAGRGSFHPALALTLFVPDLFGASGSMWDYWGPPSYQWDQIWGRPDLNIAQNVGQLYMGAIPAILALAGLYSGILWSREVRFFSAALGVAFLYALGWYTPVFGILHAYLPGVGLFRRPADAVFLIGFLGAILAGYTTHRLLLIEAQVGERRLQRACLAVAITIALAFASAAVLGLLMDRTGMGSGPMAMSAAAFILAAAIVATAVWINPIRPLLAAMLLAGFTVLDLAWFNGPSSSTAMPTRMLEFLQPHSDNETIALLKKKVAAGTAADVNRRDRVELAGLGFHWPNATMTHRLEHTLGYNPIRLQPYADATGAKDTVGLPEQREFSALFPGYNSKLADLLGLRYVVTKGEIESVDKRFKTGDLEFVARTLDGFVYENPRALPRVIFASGATPARFDQILKTGVWPDVDLESTVLLSEFDEKSAGLIANRGRGDVQLVTYRNTEVVIDVHSARGGYVVLHDLWHPWWSATLDERPVRILKANVLFRAVRIPPGTHRVVFRFEPLRGLALGLWRKSPADRE